MLTLYWGFFITGIIFAVFTIILGDIIHHALDSILGYLDSCILNSVVIRTMITIFGGTGILFTKDTHMEPLQIALYSLLVAILFSAFAYFVYVKPMKNAENSTSFSINSLIGNTAIVITSIPEDGFGEVHVKVGAGRTNQIAKSVSGCRIAQGCEVEVVKVEDNILYVIQKDN